MSFASVQWGAWGQVGMATTNAGVLARIDRIGMGVLSPEQGMAALTGVMASVGNIAASPFVWDRLSKVMKPPPEMVLALVDQALAVQSLAEFNSKKKSGAEGRGRVMKGARRQQQRQVSDKASGGDKRGGGPTLSSVQARVEDIISALIGRDVEAEEPLKDAGLDSLSGTELKSQMEAEFGVDLPETVVFDYPTAAALSAFIIEQQQTAGGDDDVREDDGDEEDDDGDAYVRGSGRSRGHGRRRRGVRRSRRSSEPRPKKSGGGGDDNGGKASGADATAATQERVVAIISALIGRDVELDEPLMDAGLDSLSGAELKSQMEAEFGIELPETVVFDYPTPGALSLYIYEQAGGGSLSDQNGGDGGDTDGLCSSDGDNDSYTSDYDDVSEIETKPRRRRQREPRSSGDGVSVAHIQDRVVTILSDLVGRAVEPDEPLMDAGLDSLSGMELKSQLETEFGVELPETVVFDYPTAAALSAFILEQTGGEGGVGKSSEEEVSSSEGEEAGVLRRRRIRQARGRDGKQLSYRPTAATTTARRMTVMVTGSSLVTPSPLGIGHASTSGALGDSISQAPRERWKQDVFWDLHMEHEAASGVMTPFGSFMDRVDLFDPTLFGLSRVEAQVMDVQHRSLLEGMLHARASTGLAARGADAMNGSDRCGVYVGISSNDFLVDHVKPMSTELNAFILPGNVLSVAAGRLSFVFGLRGPSMAMDTACSSSIVSTHAAMSAIASGDINAAATCGVGSLMCVLTTGLFSAARMLAADGRCKTLDAAADGYVRGESRGVIILEEQADTELVSNRSSASSAASGSGGGVAVIGTAVNQDGRSSSLTAPNGPSQQAVIRSALRGGGTAVTPVNMARLQMHGTGTGLGDPIEVGSVVAVFKRPSREDNTAAATPLTLEAVKSLVGHTAGS